MSKIFANTLKWVEAQGFPNLILKLCLMVCLVSKLISWYYIAFDTNIAMVSFKYFEHAIEFDMNTAMVSLTFEILRVA